MEYTTLGKTGIEVSRISFGGMSLSADDLEQSAQTVFHAFENGMNFFETSCVYADGASEKAIGIAIPEMKKTGRPFYISSKCKEYELDRLRGTLETSLSRLGLDTLDFFTPLWAVKSKTEWETLKVQGALDSLMQLKSEGLIRHILFTAHTETANLEYILNDFPDFDVLVFGYNIINHPWRQKCLEIAKAKNIGTVVMNPLGSAVIPERADIFSSVFGVDGQALIDGAYSFILSNPHVDTVLGGFKNNTEVDSAVGALERFRPYQQQQIDGLCAALREKVHSLPREERKALSERLTKCMYLVRAENALLTGVYVLGIFGRY